MKLSWFSLARNKPYGLVLLSGVMLAASFPPSPFWFLSLIAFIPIFIFADIVPERVYEDVIFLPVKRFFTYIWQVITLPLRILYKLTTEYVIRTQPKGTFRLLGVNRNIISGKAQLFRYYYAMFLLWNALCCYWLCLTALGAFSLEEAITNSLAGFLAITLNPLLMYLPVMVVLWMRPGLKPQIVALLFIPLWLTFEFLHLHWDLSWSWLTLGHALTYAPYMIQYVEFTGVLGASFFILVSNYLIYLCYREWSHTGNRKRAILLALPAALWVGLPLILNPWILDPSRDVFRPSGELQVRVIQPNIDPFQKWEVKNREEQVEVFRRLMHTARHDSAQLVILPETAIPKAIQAKNFRTDRLTHPLVQLVDSGGYSLLTGYTETRVFASGDKIPVSARPADPGRWYDHCNSAIMITPGGQSPSYQKSKMVPLVERMPFMDFMSFLKDHNITLGADLGSYGLPDSLVIPETREGVKVGLMICYESEFGDFVRQSTLRGAQLLAIITNDGWWSKSSGYVQHAQLAVLRAIENRRCIARSANTGRSMFVNEKGEISDATDFWRETVIDRKTPLYEAKTTYVLHGDFVGWIVCVISVVMILGAFLRKRKKKKDAIPETVV